MITAAENETQPQAQPICALGANGFVFSLAALPAFGFVFSSPGLPETRVRGLPAGNHAGVGGCRPVTSTLVWACGYCCDGTASGSLDQRFYANTYGRFNTPDPYKASGGTSDPASWNRYSYVEGDPVNAKDPRGLFLYAAEDNDGGGGDDGGDDDFGWDYFGPVYYQPQSPQQPAGGGGGGSPPCNPTGSSAVTTEISFILKNYQAAAAVAKEADQGFQGLNAQNFNAADVLGWAAQESGYQQPSANPDSGLKSGNLDYFNLRAGALWINQVACPSGANSYWACFGSFQGAAEAALFSPTQYGSYQGAPNVSAGFVLGQQLGSGASLATAFQTMSSAVHYAQNPNYGTAVQSAVNSVSSLLPCLQQHYASSF